jgi:HEPN superfamily RiboL-PSP-like protein
MAIRAKDAFDHAMERTEHFLTLYDVLHDTRQRNVRSDWADSFKELMNWPDSETFVRIDGQDKNSILILRESLGIDRSHFAHDYLSELLRSAIVTSVSALDRYFHDLIVHYCWKLLNRNEEDIPNKLKGLKIPLLAVKKALKKQKEKSNSRPGHIVKEKIQEILHRDYTFQNPDNLSDAASLLGIEKFWVKVSRVMSGNVSAEEAKDKLRGIAKRRNQIVHEADLILKTKAKEITLREININEVDGIKIWVEEFIEAVEKIVIGELGR